jgi:hypothetical protein
MAGVNKETPPKDVIDEQQAWMNAFIERAGFRHGWSNLESWARRMAEQAWQERNTVFGQTFEPPVCCGKFAECHQACTPRGHWEAEQRRKAEPPRTAMPIPSVHSEEFIALRDAHEMASAEAYFKPRAQAHLTHSVHRIYSDGFDRGFNSGWLVRDEYK